MERVESTPRVCFEVEKIIGISTDGNYQVQWRPAWVSKFHLVGCEDLIQEFLQQQQSGKSSLSISELPSTAKSYEDSSASTEVDLSEPHGTVTAAPVDKVQQLGDDRFNAGTVIKQPHFEKNENRDSSASTEVDHNLSAPYGIVTATQIDKVQQLGVDQFDTGTIIEEPHIERNENKDSRPITVAATIKVEEDPDIQSETSPMVYILNSESSNPWYSHPYSDGAGTGNNSSKLDTTKPFSYKTFDTTSEPFSLRETSSNKRHECPHCEKTFKQSSHLKSHLKIHSGEKPHRCSYCKATFAHKHNMERHYRTHIGVNPFMCDVCGQAFSFKTDLKRHSCSRDQKM